MSEIKALPKIPILDKNVDRTITTALNELYSKVNEVVTATNTNTTNISTLSSKTSTT